MSTHKYMDKICCLALLLALVVTGVFLNAPSLGIQAATTAQGYTGSMIHNYYLYEEDGQLSMIPWDYNLAFGGFQGGQDATSMVNYPIDTPVSGGTVDSRPTAPAPGRLRATGTARIPTIPLFPAATPFTTG